MSVLRCRTCAYLKLRSGRKEISGVTKEGLVIPVAGRLGGVIIGEAELIAFTNLIVNPKSQHHEVGVWEDVDKLLMVATGDGES